MPATAGRVLEQQNAYDSFQGLLALARLTGSSADEVRGAWHANLKVQAMQKYKQSIGLIVESSNTRESLLHSANSWGSKAFESFVSVAPPKERHQILVHDVPVDLTMEEIHAGLLEDNFILTITENPRWLLKDLSSKRRSSVLVALSDKHAA
ncbi:hypothetical protein R1sor_019734 [Riccia sorocarpa]|uniref:Uncharacterized protein n=1 Tax=Riccia sorocarpa TaxID=122646 RepID=A0ABD3IHQ0_9MARC